MGLTSPAAERLLSEVGPNELPRPQRPSPTLRLLCEMTEPLVLLLLVAAAASGVLLHELLDAAAIGVIVVINATIGLVEEGRATRALEALRAMTAPRARLVRDGLERDVPACAVVPGDLVVVTAGDRVPADALLMTAEGWRPTGRCSPASRCRSARPLAGPTRPAASPQERR